MEATARQMEATKAIKKQQNVDETECSFLSNHQRENEATT